MNYRDATILAAGSLDSAGTKVIDINVRDIISRITLDWKVTKADIGMNSYAHKDITKIELVDGSDVLYSMDGGQCQALCIYDRRCPTMNHCQFLQGASQRSLYGIDFGRFLFDPELALDPTRFRNLQLKVTYDEDVSDETVTENELAVYAKVFDEKVVSPAGFLMSKEHYAYTIGSTGYVYVDLPTDYPIRKMLIQGYVKGAEPWYQIAEARLDEDNDKRIPFDWDLETYARIMKGVWAPVEEVVIGLVMTGGSHFYVTPTDYYASLANMLIGTGVTGICNMNGWGTGGDLYLIANANSQFCAIVHGYLPNHCFEFPFGDQKDIADWYDVTRLGSLRLRLKGGTGAAGDGAVVLQQLRRY